MSNKEYHLINVLFVALFICLFLAPFVLGEGDNNYVSCQILETTGLECKSCGLTRDFISFVHLDFESPINDQSIFIFLWFLIQFLFRSVIASKPTLISGKIKWSDLVLSTCTAIIVFLPFWV